MKTIKIHRAIADKLSDQERAAMTGKIDLVTIINGITIRPVSVMGHGQYSKNYRSKKADVLINKLSDSGLFHHLTGNDAPRGGKAGEYHIFRVITPNIRLRELIDRYNKRLIYLQMIAKQAKENEHNREVERVTRWLNDHQDWLKEKIDSGKYSFVSCKTTRNSLYHLAGRAKTTCAAMKEAWYIHAQ